MPKTELIRNSFTGGEISPFLLGRSDMAKYHNGCESIINFFVRVEGGIQKRWGTRYIIDTTGPDRLIPFSFSATAKYILEFGNNLIQFYFNDGQIQLPAPPPNVPYQVGTPYATSELWDIHYVQNYSTMYLCHPNHPPAKLVRLSDTNWQYIPLTFYSPPAIQADQDVGTAKGANITITGGDIVTASSPVFIDGDIGKAVIAGTGIGFINGYGPSDTTATDGGTGATLHTQVVTTVTSAFDTTSYAHGSWFLRGGPNAFFSPGSFDGTGTPPKNLWSGRGPQGFGGGFQVRSTTAHPTDHSWQRSTGSAYVDVQYNDGFTDAFRQIDNGLFVNFDGGYAQIVNVLNSTTVNVNIINITTVTEQNAWGNPLVAPAPPGSWWLEASAFGPGNYPHAVTLYGDRLYFAGTMGSNPNTVWGSNVGDYENFALGSLADEGVRFTINSGTFEHIHWMTVFQGSIVAGGVENEYIINGGAGQQIISSGAPITPQNINVITQSSYGVASIQPLLVDNDLIFIQKAKLNAYQFAFNAVTSSFGSRDLNVLNSFIADVGFKEFTYQKRPFKILWFVDLAGDLIGLTYDKDNDVWAWHRHQTGTDTNDKVISAATITVNQGTTDETWLLVQRQRESATRWSIEILTSYMNVDCGLYNSFSSPVSSVSGFGYLTGRPVTGTVDGMVLPTITMSGTGIYTFPPGLTGKVVQLGLAYTSTAVTTRPEPRATIQGLYKRWLKLWARLYYTVGLFINGQEVYFMNLDTTLMVGNPAVTGDVQVNNLGFDRDGRIVLVQSYPLPAHILGVFGPIEVGEV